ncbi:hypothetical protein B0H10DRAFT_2441737 [Mycena sp. CBHHK59/15]|nr:hypothetical protein B0H10DRAFT_2441737 [Mycena sp. CBHHK59/15]
MSVRTASGKRMTLKDDYENGQLAISEVDFEHQMGYLQARKPEPGKQLTLGDMFKKRPCAVISSSPVPTKGLKGDSASSSAAAVELHEEEEESSSSSELETGKSDLDNYEEEHPELLEQEARSKEGDVAVDSIIVADKIAEWVETVLEDAAPPHPSELASLAADGLKKAGMINPKLLQQHVNETLILALSFDNSSAHGSLAKNALIVTKMNVNPGSKVPEMQETVITSDNPHVHSGKPQKIVFDNPLPNDHPHKKFEGQPKGMKASMAGKPHLDSASPNEEAEMFSDDGNNSDEEEEQPVDCCMHRSLSQQPDFVGEKSQLELLIEAAPGMVCHFLPKFHLEMNPIEYFWAWIKHYFRERSNGQWKKAQELVTEALAACPLPTIRRFFRRADQYASVYRHSVTGPVAEFAVKQYCSHRGVKKTEIEVAEAQWKKKSQLDS